MSYCDKCGVHITGSHNHCPLCGKTLGENDTESPAFYPLVPVRTSYNLIFKISTFMALVGIFVINIINFAFIPHLSLYIPLTISCICAWMIVNIGYYKRKNIPKNILYEAIIVILLSIIWDHLTGWHQWSINYVLPISTASLHIFYFVMAIVDIRNKTAYGIYFLMSMVGAILVAGLFFANIITVRPFSAISVGIGLSLLCFQLLFRWRTFSSEIHSRFHF